VWAAFGQALPFAVGVALSPLPIIAVVLILLTPRAKANAVAFLAGLVVAIGVGGAVAMAIVGSSSSGDDSAPATWTGWLRLVLGVVLFRVAGRQWRARPAPGEEAEMPSWMGSLDALTATKAAGAGVVLGIVNPKNLLLVIGGATVVAQADLSGADQAVTWLLFTLVGSLGVAVPVVLYLAMGDRARPRLDAIEAWMTQNSSVIVAVICVLLGAKLIGDGITVLSL
jgi:hypothetical protein